VICCQIKTQAIAGRTPQRDPMIGANPYPAI